MHYNSGLTLVIFLVTFFVLHFSCTVELWKKNIQGNILCTPMYLSVSLSKRQSADPLPELCVCQSDGERGGEEGVPSVSSQ